MLIARDSRRVTESMIILPRPGATYQHPVLGEVRFEQDLYSGEQLVISHLCIRLDTGEEVLISEGELGSIRSYPETDRDPN